MTIGKINALQPGYGVHGNLHPDHTGTLLTLRVNGEPVLTTGAGRPGYWDNRQVSSGFLFKVKALFDYLGDGDCLTVTAGDVALPWAGGALEWPVTMGRASRMPELLALIAAGQTFQKNGLLGLRLDRNPAFFAEVERLFARIAGVVQREAGLEVFVTYGALLGCIREGDFIASDDDIDLAYLSRHHTAAEVRTEFERIARALIHDGLHVKVGMYRNLIKISAEKNSIPIDLFYAWTTESGEFDISYGSHGPAFRVESQPLALVPGRIGRYTLPIPACHDAMLMQLYGAQWRVPDQGFSHFDKTRRISPEFALDDAASLRLYWENFYAHQGAMRPSSFAEFMAPRLPAGARVLEFGCGHGRDALHFARGGTTVVGADASHEAIAAARRQATEGDLARAQFEVVDLSDTAALDAHLQVQARAAAAAGQAVVVYCRFFLHAIPADLEARLIDALCRHLTAGFQFAAEFRTDHDEKLKKSFGTTHYRRFIDPELLISRLERERGATREFVQIGFGLSVYAGEDPHLCRMILGMPAQGSPS